MDTALQIGQKIKYYRMLKNLTIKDLAAQAQITTSMLSQIERGQANPSLNTIRLLSMALDEPIFRFFMDEVNVQDEVVRVNRRKQIIENGVEYEMLTPDTNGVVEMMQMKLAPGSTSYEKPIGHEGEEVALVLSGPVELMLENETCVLNTGDSVRIKSELKHSWFNSSNQDSIVVFAISPPSF